MCVLRKSPSTPAPVPSSLPCYSVMFSGRSRLGRGQSKQMIDSQKNHGYGKNQQDNHPGSFVGCQQSGICIQFDKIPSQVHQTTCCQNLCYVIKSSLPTNKPCLVFIGQLTHIYSVAGDVVSSSAKSNNGQQRNGDTEKWDRFNAKATNPKVIPVIN